MLMMLPSLSFISSWFMSVALRDHKDHRSSGVVIAVPADQHTNALSSCQQPFISTGTTFVNALFSHTQHLTGLFD